MLTIGLTGNIGSGKSSVSRYLADSGAIIIDADQVARDIVQPGAPALAEIFGCFGPGVLNEAGDLNRKMLGSIVFADAEAMAKLNAITHRRIVQAITEEKRRFNSLPGFQDKLLVVDAPLLIEVGLHKGVDEIWLVQINAEKQIERLIVRDGLSKKEALERVAAQMPQAEKLKYANRVIDNNGTFEDTKNQIDSYLADLKFRRV